MYKRVSVEQAFAFSDVSLFKKCKTPRFCSVYWFCLCTVAFQYKFKKPVLNGKACQCQEDKVDKNKKS